MNWLVTGVTGLLGANAALDLSESSSVTGAARRIPPSAPVNRLELDLSDVHSRASAVARADATVVLHAAAISSIEECERQPELAAEVNVAASADLARQAAAAGAAFIYISTDAVFDGVRGSYREKDEPSPTTTYGRTKRDGELAVLDAHPSPLIARVNFYGWSPTGRRSLAEFFHSRLSADEQAPGFDDVIVSTMYVRSLVDRLAALVGADASGIVNVAGDEAISKYDFGVLLARTFALEPKLIRRAQSSDHLAVRRGAHLDLDTTYVRTLLNASAITQSADMRRMMTDETAGWRRSVAAFTAE